MRKSTGAIMTIILLALVGMMFAANVALKPYERYARIGKDLTNILGMRGELRPETKVFVLVKAANERGLASRGHGMLIELAPSDSVMVRKGRLEKLAYRATREAGHIYREGRGKPLEWFEVKLDLGGGLVKRTLMTVGPQGQIGPQAPALPLTHVPEAPTHPRQAIPAKRNSGS